MNTEITVESPEFRALYDEISQRNESIRKREELGESSFRRWLCEKIVELGEQLGYHIQNIYEFAADMTYSFSKGFEAGRNRAKAEAIRRQWKRDGRL